MGKADIAVKNWLNDNERFADLFNGTVFDGQQIILPDELENLDREADILITDKKTDEEDFNATEILQSAGEARWILLFSPVKIRTISIMPCLYVEC